MSQCNPFLTFLVPGCMTNANWIPVLSESYNVHFCIKVLHRLSADSVALRPNCADSPADLQCTHITYDIRHMLSVALKALTVPNLNYRHVTNGDHIRNPPIQKYDSDKTVTHRTKSTKLKL